MYLTVLKFFLEVNCSFKNFIFRLRDSTRMNILIWVSHIYKHGIIKPQCVIYADVLSSESSVGSVVEWLKRWLVTHGLGSKPTPAILLCPWERHFRAHSPDWWSWQAILNYNHISIELQADLGISGSRSG